ncbi:hypothetical protein G7Y89_g11004 [Cudoniella acicularis]|uniref:Uncharacterized protein n=1 Tax=Cudoniella acicularis TaxID=354080 RepID=A0A8H4RDZ0_9HELO|nr:hypothetical protein G7Y89_g11004 [Cudoniella acicularis]
MIDPLEIIKITDEMAQRLREALEDMGKSPTPSLCGSEFSELKYLGRSSRTSQQSSTQSSGIGGSGTSRSSETESMTILTDTDGGASVGLYLDIPQFTFGYLDYTSDLPQLAEHISGILQGYKMGCATILLFAFHHHAEPQAPRRPTPLFNPRKYKFPAPATPVHTTVVDEITATLENTHLPPDSPYISQAFIYESLSKLKQDEEFVEECRSKEAEDPYRGIDMNKGWNRVRWAGDLHFCDHYELYFWDIRGGTHVSKGAPEDMMKVVETLNSFSFSKQLEPFVLGWEDVKDMGFGLVFVGEGYGLLGEVRGLGTWWARRKHVFAGMKGKGFMTEVDARVKEIQNGLKIWHNQGGNTKEALKRKLGDPRKEPIPASYRRKGKQQKVPCKELAIPQAGIHDLAWAQAIVPAEEETESLYLICKQSYVDVYGSGLLYQFKRFFSLSPVCMLNYLSVINPIHKEALAQLQLNFHLTEKSWKLKPDSALAFIARLPSLKKLAIWASIRNDLIEFKPLRWNPWQSPTRWVQYSIPERVLESIRTNGILNSIRGLSEFDLVILPYGAITNDETEYQKKEGEDDRWDAVEETSREVVYRAKTDNTIRAWARFSAESFLERRRMA